MGLVIDLFKMKIKVLFGSLRASKTSLLLFLVYFLGMLPAAIGLSMSAVELLQRGVEFLSAYVDTLAAIISGFMALALISTYTGFKVFEYEQGFVLTAPINPRQYLLADLLSDMVVLIFFFNMVPISLMIVAIRLALSITSILVMFFSFLLFVFFVGFLKYSLSIYASIYEGIGLKIVTSAVIVVLLLPAAGLFAPLSIRYGELPYPTTFLARCILESLSNRLCIGSFLGLGLHFMALLAIFLASSRRNFFPFANPIPLMSPFDTSMRMQSIKVGKSMKTFSHIGLRMTLNPDSKSLLRFLMKKEFLRMVRDGSLFTTLLMYTILSFIVMFSTERGAPTPIWLSILMVYSFMVPSMLINLWRVVEMDSLWMPLTSGMSLDNLVKAILYDLVMIAFAIPAAFIAAFTIFNRIDPLMPLVLVFSVSMIGCSANLYVVTRFLGRKHRAAPWMMISWASLLLTALLLTPTYIFSGLSLLWNFSLQLNAILSTSIIAYSILAFIYLSKATAKAALSIEI